MIINFMKAGEKPDPTTVLGRMGEDKTCLITGTKTDLTYLPVDLDPSNILPSNMACVTNEIAKDITYSYYYEATLGSYKILFDTPPQFEEHNMSMVNALPKENFVYDQKLGPQNFIAAFEALTARHLKGIFRISHANYILDRTQYQGHLYRMLLKRQSASLIHTL